MSKISDFLLTGRKNAISMTDLSHVADIPERSVRLEILQARIAGELICSCEQGYFLPETVDDIREYVISRKAYLKTANKALKPFVKAIQ